MHQSIMLKCLAIAALCSTLAFTNCNGLPDSVISRLVDMLGGKSKKFSASSMFADKACTGTPLAVMYSNVKSDMKDGKCESSIKTNLDITDVFFDAMKRYGCSTSFVLIGMGEKCQVGTKIRGTNVTSWIALQADGVCRPDSVYTEPNNLRIASMTSTRVELRDETLKITYYKGNSCQTENQVTKIDANSRRVGNYFCEVGGLHQIYDASGKSKLFKSTVTTADCKNNKNVHGVSNQKSSASMHGVGLLASVVGLAATASMLL